MNARKRRCPLLGRLASRERPSPLADDRRPGSRSPCCGRRDRGAPRRSLTTEGQPTNNPQSERAIDVMGRAFPPDPSTLVHRHRDRALRPSYTRTLPQFERSSSARRRERSRRALVRSARTYLDGDPVARLRDRHATLLPLAIADEDEVEAVIEAVRMPTRRHVRGRDHRRPDARPRLQPALAGGPRERRALVRPPGGPVILLLVFGAVVAGLVPAPPRDRLDLRRARADGACSRSRSSSPSSS